MPVYEYEHAGEGCPRGKRFDFYQHIEDERLTTCPECGRPVERVISRVFVSTPMTDSELKSKGFAKLVRRDSGVYENVTALDGESRVWEADKTDTMPDIKRRITD
ncbi:zinc ribbon domain-containing protein [Candidatus Sumerlaeota bacterium]|nr:zinc ribbon domain-containing protein [Candidatus Sumerlaeota bacterium]